MKTLLHYIALFVLHFAFSLLFNLIFGETESIGRTLLSSSLFVLLFFVFEHFILKKWKS